MYVIDDQDIIDDAQRKFGNLLKKEGRPERKALGFQGGNFKNDVYFLDAYQFWWSYTDEETRHWNAFGVYDNTREWKSGGDDIVCEINPPIGSRQSKGACVSDGKEVYIAHTGKLNGKTHDGKYCTTASFREHAKNLNWKQIQWYNGKQKEVVIISSLEDDHLIYNIKTFIDEVHKYKKGKSAYLDKGNNGKGPSKEYVARRLERDNLTTQLIKKNRGYKCQICGKHIIRKENTLPYVEAAHIKSKSEGGKETTDNIIIMCPNHHAEFDMGERQITKHTKTEIQFILNDKKHQIRLGVW